MEKIFVFVTHGSVHENARYIVCGEDEIPAGICRNGVWSLYGDYADCSSAYAAAEEWLQEGGTGEE